MSFNRLVKVNPYKPVAIPNDKQFINISTGSELKFVEDFTHPSNTSDLAPPGMIPSSFHFSTLFGYASFSTNSIFSYLGLYISANIASAIFTHLLCGSSSNIPNSSPNMSRAFWLFITPLCSPTYFTFRAVFSTTCR